MSEPAENTSQEITQPQQTAPIETSHNSQKVTTFEPSDNQIKWVNAALAKASASPSEIADEVGLDRRTFYKWMEDPEFRKWWEAQWATYYESVKSRLIESGVKNAQTNHDWWRDMMEFVGFRKPEQEKPQTQNTINVMANAFSAKKEERGS